MKNFIKNFRAKLGTLTTAILGFVVSVVLAIIAKKTGAADPMIWWFACPVATLMLGVLCEMITSKSVHEEVNPKNFLGTAIGCLVAGIVVALSAYL